MCELAAIGATAYARSLEDCSFSTQEVILSMLEHDSTFRNLVLAESSAAGIDPINFEFAIADAHRYCLAMESMQSRRGKAQRPAWATEQAQDIWAVAGGAVAVDGDTHTAGRICVIIPSSWDLYQKAALQLLYSYWGVPYEVDVRI